MLSIGNFAKSANVSPRTIRYYESIGLLPKSLRAENNYRSYDIKWLDRMTRIRDLQGLGFSLDDIKIILNFSESELHVRLQEKLLEIECEFLDLQERRRRIKDLLSVANKIETGEKLTDAERTLYMESIKEEVLSGLQKRYTQVPELALDYLKRDTWLDIHPQAGEFIEAVKKCMEFAKSRNLTLGTARGGSPASISFFGLGFSSVDPLKYEMIPERLSTQKPYFHIDVEFERGQDFVDFCREINKSLPYGEIQAFKMPLIDIVQNTHQAIGDAIDYEAVDDNSDWVLNPFREGDFEKIFQFDFSKDALVMAYENFFPEYLGLRKITEHFEGQTDFTFRDIINVTALWRPRTQELIDRIELYKKAKSEPFSYGFLSDKIQKSLRSNFGVIIYHEDIMRIISEYTGWDLTKSNELRRLCMNEKNGTTLDLNTDWMEFKSKAPKEVVDLVAKESPWTFCLPHAIAFAKFTKQTAVLKTRHKTAYFQQIDQFEQKHGFKWDDIGVYFKGVSLLQG